MKCSFIWIAAAYMIHISFLNANEDVEQENKEEQTSIQFPIPLGLPPIAWPEDNPFSAAKAELGRILYFDPRLSSDGSVSCASCHSVARGFSDHSPFSEGIHQRLGTRNSPTIINSAYLTYQFWDGRAKTLEDQAIGPIANFNEMTNEEDIQAAYQSCQQRIKEVAGYRSLFKEAFGSEECSLEHIAKAIATFERTILSGNSPYDRFKAGDPDALSDSQKRGMTLFSDLGCIKCHSGPTFASGGFANIGIGMDHENPDLGRYEVTQNQKDWGAFKVPALRDVLYTYPYMHDGSLKTLSDVVNYYDKGGIPNANLNPLMRPLHLSNEQKQDLVAFLEALSGEGWQHFSAPTHLPE